ncbi:MAG: RNA methyltransferase [Saprospiraceae bacterium]|nr:RNA methyltransferase [Saprospiraceae bacterium]
MRPERLQKILTLAKHRQLDLTVVLENVHDPHNISAVMRTCDAVGICDVYILNTDPSLQSQRFKPGKRTTSGSRKWVHAHLFKDLEECFSAVRARYERIYTTQVDPKLPSYFDIDLTNSLALVFGNEHTGVSNEARSKADGSICIPQVGMVHSLNISVACAVVLYEVYRQRDAKNMYGLIADRNRAYYNQLLDDYLGDQAIEFKL